jgi:hypothetical protein
MRIARSRLMTLLVTSIAAMACGASATVARQSPAAPAVAATVDVHCQDLRQRGITPCPPSRLPPEPIVVRNGTHGAVDDATVRAQGHAYLREHALYDWAVRQPDGGTFLMSGAITPPEVARTNVFRMEVQVFSDARASRGTVRIEPLQTTEITLVPVPQALQDAARRDGLQPSPYGWVDNQAGPARVTVQAAGGAAHDVLRIAPGEPHPILVFGQVREDADLGSIWYVGGYFGCLASAQLRIACGL